LESIVFEVGDQPGAIPEHLIANLSVVDDSDGFKRITYQYSDKESHRLGQREELSAERFEILSGSSNLFLYILRQYSSRVKLATVLMAPAASHANSIRMGPFIDLVLHNHDPQTDISCRDNEWYESNPHQRQFPTIAKTNDAPTKYRDAGLKNAADGHPTESRYLLWVLR
jgi:hypothetical protein